MKLIAIILTRNEEKHIAACIHSVKWADAVLVFDSFSTDRTLEIARECGAQVIQHAFVNYSEQREAALQATDAEWVLFLDADERTTSALAAEVRAAIEDSSVDGYWIPRHNYIFGKVTLGAGWYPDHQLRLLRRAKAHYDLTREVHELVKVEGAEGYLKTPLIHYNYENAAQFAEKQRRYTRFAAQEMYAQGIRVKPQNYVLQPLRHFLWRFVTLKGYRIGWHGLRLSLLMAWYEFKKYQWLAQLWRKASQAASAAP